ncbi:S8 family peptidase [Labedaea rhizosphaerae]|uniref:Subtilase family protein n=1 Tax=Labedaea rhizosphaerae TaxID=598644 RepID=A0A4R6S949_LABRH|nr:S8 family serine peptidase [Labedaea rhizosphaerae]TDP96321.1 subtilase family protein [Labedaea rhizosphaerae]
MRAPRGAKVAAVCAAVVVTGLLPLSTAAASGPDPVPGECTPTGHQLRYLVVFDPGTVEQTAKSQIGAACGATTIYYPQIAVAVATTEDSHFDDRIGPERAFSAQRLAETDDGTAHRRKADETHASKSTHATEQVSTVDRADDQWDMRMIGADKAHLLLEGSKDVVVGVLDSGVDAKHPDLADAVAANKSAGCLSGKPDTSPKAWAPTGSAHGTHVAGIIAAADDGKGVAGVAPGVRIASVKVVDDDGLIYPEAAVCGLMWAAKQHMTVTNNSYFVDPWLLTCDHDGSEGVVYEAVRRAVRYSTQQGVATVAAATNEATDLSDPQAQPTSDSTVGTDQADRQLDRGCKVLPAGLRDVIAVSAVGENGVKAGYSSYGLGVVDVTAPGGEFTRSATDPNSECVLSTVPGGYDRFCGTSMAAPHATGVVALLASRHPGSTPRELATMLTGEASQVPCPADYDLNGTGTQDGYCTGYGPYNGFYGHGLVNALAAVTG